MHKYIHAYIYVCIHIYIYVLVYTCICAYICMYICVDIRMYVCIRFVLFSPVASVVHVCTCSIPFQYTPGAFSHTYSFHTKRMSMGPDCTWINGDDYDICCQDCGGAIKITGYCSLSVLLTCMRYLPCQYSLLSFNSSPHILIPFVHTGAWSALSFLPMSPLIFVYSAFSSCPFRDYPCIEIWPFVMSDYPSYNMSSSPSILVSRARFPSCPFCVCNATSLQLFSPPPYFAPCIA